MSETNEGGRGGGAWRAGAVGEGRSEMELRRCCCDPASAPSVQQKNGKEQGEHWRGDGFMMDYQWRLKYVFSDIGSSISSFE